MPKPINSIDYRKLEDQLLKRTYKLSEVQDKIEKVAFDIVRFKDDDKGASLWQVQNADDGEYIISLYEEPAVSKTASASSWQIEKTGQSLQFFYKGAPIVKMATDKLGIPVSELSTVERYLPAKLSSNKELVKALLNELTEPAKEMVYNKYPELA